jgi:hypothetical protein
VSAVAAGDERDFADVDTVACALKPRDDAIVAFLESDEFRLPLDLYSSVAQPIDQQLLVLVLRKNERIGIRADASAHRSDHQSRNLAPRDPQIRG